MKKLIVIMAVLLFACVLHGQIYNTSESVISSGWSGNLELRDGWYGKTEVESVKLINGKLVIHYSQLDNSYSCLVLGCTADHSVTTHWKDFYVAKNGEIVFEKRIEGKYRTIIKEVEEQELYFEESK